MFATPNRPAPRLRLVTLLLALLAAGIMPLAAAATSVPFPFFSQVRCPSAGQWPPTLQAFLPDVHNALIRLTETERLLRPAQIREIRLAGLLEEDTIRLCIFLYGDFDLADIRAARPADLREMGRIGGFPLYELAPRALPQPAVYLLLPQAGQLVAGRVETLRRVMGLDMPMRLPELFGEFADPDAEFRLFLQPPFFEALPERPPGDESYQALTELFGRVEAVALALDSTDGDLELLLRCREDGDAERIVVLLRNFIGLMLLSTAPEDQISGILKQCVITHWSGLVRARLRLPADIREELFRGGPAGRSDRPPPFTESPRP